MVRINLGIFLPRCSRIFTLNVPWILELKRQIVRVFDLVHSGILSFIAPPLTPLSLPSCTLVISMALRIGVELNDALQGASLIHVWDVELIHSVPFYGYHPDKIPFIKLSFLFPRSIREAANLLRSGRILNRLFTPYEAHIPFPLQFMADYNLYCMDHLIIRRLRLRRSPSTLTSGRPAFDERVY